MKRRPGATPGRALRVTELLHQEIAELIRTEVKDPRLGLVTVTGVDLTPDYAHATVHFSVLPDDDERVAETLRGLRAASGFLRSLIGRRVRIHTTPELHFVHDASAQRGIEMGPTRGVPPMIRVTLRRKLGKGRLDCLMAHRPVPPLQRQTRLLPLLAPRAMTTDRTHRA